MSFDIVIPTTKKDLNTLEECIAACKKYIKNYRNIIVISDKQYTNNALWFNEDNFQFSKNDLINIIGEHWRFGWYYQQLLKLYAPFTIPNISDNILILDSDTIFLKNIDFFHDNKPCYNYGTANHKPYFRHMKQLHSDLTRQDKKKSGICHHMIFQTHILRELFYKIETKHKKDFWRIFLESVDLSEKSGASEYEIYFNYILKFHNENIKIRRLQWENSSKIDDNKDLHYVSKHSYLKV